MNLLSISSLERLWSAPVGEIDFGYMYFGNIVTSFLLCIKEDMGRAKRIWYLSPMRAAKVQASLRIRAVSPEPPLLAHTSSESRGTFGQKARSLAPLNGWACAVKIGHDGMLEDTNSLDAAHMYDQWLHVVSKVGNKTCTRQRFLLKTGTFEFKQVNYQYLVQ